MQILDEPSQLLAIFQPLKLDESCTKVGPSNKANTCPDSRPEDDLGNHQHVTCHRFFSPHSPEIWISNVILYYLYENGERDLYYMLIYCLHTMHDDIVYMSIALLLQYCDYSVISYHHRCHNHCNPCRHHRLHQCHRWSLSSSCLLAYCQCSTSCQHQSQYQKRRKLSAALAH